MSGENMLQKAAKVRQKSLQGAQGRFGHASSVEDVHLPEQQITEAVETVNKELITYTDSLGNKDNEIKDSVEVVDKKENIDGERKEGISSVLNEISQAMEDSMHEIEQRFVDPSFEVKLLKREDFPEISTMFHSQEEIDEMMKTIDDANSELNDYLAILRKKIQQNEKPESEHDEQQLKDLEEKREEFDIPKEEQKIINPPIQPQEQLESQKLAEAEKNIERKSIDEITMDEILEEAREQLARDRSEYANAEYREMNDWQRIKKFLDVKETGKYKETQNVISLRDRYEKELRLCKQLEMKKLRSSEVSEDKLKEIHKYFRFDETVKFYDARTEAKLKYLAEKEGKGKAKRVVDELRLFGNNIIEGYKKMPDYAKYTLAAISFLPGTEAYRAGRRVWSSWMLMGAGGMQIDTLVFKNYDRVATALVGNMMIKDVRQGEVIGEKFNLEKFENRLDNEIANLDKRLNDRILRSHFSKTMAFIGGLFFSYSAFRDVKEILDKGNKAGGAIGWIKGIFHKFTDSNVDATNHVANALPKVPSGVTNLKPEDIYGSHGVDAPAGSAPHPATFGNHATAIKPGISNVEKTGVAPAAAKVPEMPKTSNIPEVKLGAALHGQPVHVREMAEKVAAAKAEGHPPTTLKVEMPEDGANGKKEYASIWKVTKGLVAGLNPNLDVHELNAQTRHVFEDGIRTYSISQGISYSEAMAQLSKIHPDTVIDVTYDSTGHPVIHIIKGKVHFMDGVFDDAHHAHTGISDIKPNISETVTSPNPDVEVYKDWNQDVVSSEAAEIAANEEKHRIASAITNGVLPEVDPNGANINENLRYAAQLQEAAMSNVYNWAPSYEMGRIGELIKHSKEHMQSLIDMPDYEAYKRIGRDFFDSKKDNIIKFGGLNAREALSNPENLEGLSTKAKKLMIGYASQPETMPKPKETLKVWTYRISKLAQAKMEQKLAA